MYLGIIYSKCLYCLFFMTFPVCHQGDPTTLPLLAWQFVIIQSKCTDRVLDPVLAFARTDMVYFYQVNASHL